MIENKHLVHLPNSELEIMIALWDIKKPVTRPEIESHLRGGQSWNPTTVLKFLSRLVNKGFVSCEPMARGKMNLYSPIVTEEEYLAFESSSVMGRLCGRSVKNLVVNLYDNNEIGDRELEELRAFIEEKRREGQGTQNR